MDKETIIKKRVAPLAPTYNLTIADCQQIVFPAMDEFAKQEAIGFAEYLSDHPLQFEPSSEKGCWIGLDLKIISSTELYSLYINQKK